MRLLLTVLLISLSVETFSQLSDIISVRRKNGRIIKTFTAGTPITFELNTGYVASGIIKIIKNDTILLTVHDVRAYPTRFGVTAVDTFASYTDPFAFHDISRIQVFRSRGFAGKLGKIIMIGSAGYFVLTLINGNYLKMPISDSKNLRSLGIAGGSFAVGFLLNRYFQQDNFTRRKHRLEYIRLR